MSAAPALAWDRLGAGPQTVVLSHALGCDRSMWQGVAEDLAADHSVLRYDHRNHGASPRTAAFGIDDLADDAAALIAACCDAPVWFVGVSMGGMAAQALAVRHPALLRGIVVAHSAAHYADRAPWDARIAAVRAGGMAAVADGAVARWLTPGFVATPHGAATAARLHATLLANDPAAYAASCHAVAATDTRASNARIALPALVVAGAHDLATPPACSVEIATAIPGAQLFTLDSAHIGPAEQPAAFAAAVRAFIAASTPSP